MITRCAAWITFFGAVYVATMLDLSELPEEPDPSLPHALPVLTAVDVRRDADVERFLADPAAMTSEEILALLPE